MKTNEEKTLKALKNVEKKLDWIGNTPLRQIIDACTCFSINAINKIDIKRCETDGDYYDHLIKLRDKISDLLDHDLLDPPVYKEMIPEDKKSDKLKKIYKSQALKPWNSKAKIRDRKISKFVRAQNYCLLTDLDIAKAMIDIISKNEGVTKTFLLLELTGKFWIGHVSGDFISKDNQIKKVFNRLVADGDIIFIPGKPLDVKK